MSKSRRKTTKTTRDASRLAPRPDLARLSPSVFGIDDAVAAVHELAAWVFELAARDMADWPEGARRVRSARRFVLDQLRGKPRRAPTEDIAFSARLLARMLDADHDLSMSEVVTILDELGLPTDEVPMVTSSPKARNAAARPIALRPRSAAVVADRSCHACGAPQLRNAA